MSFGRKGIGHKGAIDVTGIPALAGGEEFLRMWKQANGNILCVIDPARLGADPMLFGLAIVDAIRHGAKAYAHAVNVSEDHAYERIMEGVNAELANPTDVPRPLGPEGTH
ncbi:MAG TPA: DUF5076 domain-containing protein [Sphingopyxis sp.]|nr:DUF5076 domain-containing protein [Sphingopyxis sp.]HMP46066.1 DUF5076 domain-containing protein [Sphingopyxis sp.]HMQ17853.1 DUF5076 domain-containing protein [Sphingopyxis sp.]